MDLLLFLRILMYIYLECKEMGVISTAACCNKSKLEQIIYNYEEKSEMCSIHAQGGE